MNTSPTPEFLTARLRIDTLLPSDAPALFAYRSDENVARYQGWWPTELAQAETFIATQAAQVFASPESWCQLAIRDRDSSELIGDLGIHFPGTTDDAIEFGVTLRPDRQGQGYAREALGKAIDMAFREWGYRRAVGSVDPRNAASMALLRSLGFRQEAHHVASYRFREEWVDDVIFAMLATEWRGA